MSSLCPFTPTGSSNASPVDVNKSQQLVIPDVTPYLTPYILQTLEALHQVYGTSSVLVVRQLICDISSKGTLCNTRPMHDLMTYNMRSFIDNQPLPSRLPFIADHCATMIPQGGDKHSPGIMDDVIEAIRQTTVPHLQGGFYPPTAHDIQDYMAKTYPDRFPLEKDTAQGWRNSVNQCLTHGQGWNFLTFPPTDGTKNKRHLLLERAYNKSFIIGSGQCKGYNDQKAKRRGKLPKSGSLPTPPPPPSGPVTGSSSSSSLLGETATEGLARVGTSMTGTEPRRAERSLKEVEHELIRMLMPAKNASVR